MKYSILLVILSSISLSNALAVPSATLVPLGSGSGLLETEDVTQNLCVLQQLHFKKVASAVKVCLVACFIPYKLCHRYECQLKPCACTLSSANTSNNS